MRGADDDLHTIARQAQRGGIDIELEESSARCTDTDRMLPNGVDLVTLSMESWQG